MSFNKIIMGGMIFLLCVVKLVIVSKGIELNYIVCSVDGMMIGLLLIWGSQLLAEGFK